MKHLTLMSFMLAMISMFFFTNVVDARDTLHNLSVNEALEIGRGEGAILDDVRVFSPGRNIQP
jgi:hypothetical protein